MTQCHTLTHDTSPVSICGDSSLYTLLYISRAGHLHRRPFVAATVTYLNSSFRDLRAHVNVTF